MIKKTSFVFVMLFSFLAVSAIAHSGRFQWIGPEGGDIQQIVPDRRDPNLWYVIASGTLYRSTDGSGHWQKTRITAARFVVVHPVNSEVFVLAEKNSDTQIWVSQDHGQSFALRTTLDSYSPQLVIHPFDPETLYVPWIGANGMIVSYDGGRNWQDGPVIPYKLEPGYEDCSFSLAVSDFLVAPFDPNTFYADTGIEIYCGYDSGFESESWISKNAGKTWKKLNRSITNFHTDPLYPERAYALGYTNAQQTLELLTRDGIQTVSDVPGYGSRFLSVPRRPKDLFAVTATHESFKSTDAGKNWKSASIDLRHTLAALGTADDPLRTLLGGTNGGGLFLRNSRQGWTSADRGLRETTVTNVLISPISQTIYAVASELNDRPGVNRFLFGSNDQGKTWHDLSSHLPTATVFDVALDPDDSNRLALSGTHVYVSKDGGNSWSRSESPNCRYATVSTVRFDSAHSIYATCEGQINKSTDGGFSFKVMTSLPYPYRIQRTILDLNDSRILYFLSDYGGIFKSSDGGQTIAEANSGFARCCPGCSSYCAFDITPLGQKNAYLSLHGANNGGPILYKTVDGAKSWQIVGKVPFSTRISAADALGNHLYLAGYYFHESLDGGKTWKNLIGEFDPKTSTNDLSDALQSPLYVATNHGVYVQAQPVSGVVEVP